MQKLMRKSNKTDQALIVILANKINESCTSFA